MKEVIVKDQDLQKAAMEGMDEFIDVFVKAIYDAIGGELTAENMQELNADQLTLLAWKILHDEVMDGGFVQLIYNGYGPFIFKNPLAKVLRLWDMRAPSKLIYDAHTLWLKYRDEIESEKSDEDFMAMFEQYPEFEDLDDQFIENEEEWTDDLDEMAQKIMTAAAEQNHRSDDMTVELIRIRKKAEAIKKAS